MTAWLRACLVSSLVSHVMASLFLLIGSRNQPWQGWWAAPFCIAGLLIGSGPVAGQLPVWICGSFGELCQIPVVVGVYVIACHISG